MGPRSCERGNIGVHHRNGHGHQASMGPRSCERGNFKQLRKKADPYELQWGRARASAEMSVVVNIGLLSSTLQWGRARASAEMYARAVFPHPGGPSFNGAALVRARK